MPSNKNGKGLLAFIAHRRVIIWHPVFLEGKKINLKFQRNLTKNKSISISKHLHTVLQFCENLENAEKSLIEKWETMKVRIVWVEKRRYRGNNK
jgi:hypothetical protein